MALPWYVASAQSLGTATVIDEFTRQNFARFGSLLESGRALTVENPVIFHLPWTAEFWRGLHGSLIGGAIVVLVAAGNPEVSTDPGGSGDAPRTFEVRRRYGVGQHHR